MPALTEDTALIRYAVAYAIELYRELTEENGAPSLGTQNQVVDFILADPELGAAAAHWVHSSRATKPRLRPRGGCRATPPIVGSGLSSNRSWMSRFLCGRGSSRSIAADFECRRAISDKIAMQ
jgi:hypothetical protein